MKKSFKVFLAALVMAVAVPASASAFEWSECWCNYGGGIEKGDLIITASSGLYYADAAYWSYHEAWFIPPVMLEVQFAQPIWRLPFTFGGYAGFHAYGYQNIDHYEWVNGRFVPVYNTNSYWGMFIGGEAAYHIQLPPEGLDVYGVTRMGASIPFVRPSDNIWTPNYFNFSEAIGANWYFGDVFGVNLEMGYPMLKVGVSLKF